MRPDCMFIPVRDHKESLHQPVKAVRPVPLTYYHCFVCIQNTQHTDLMRSQHQNQLQASLSYTGHTDSKTSTLTGSRLHTPLALLL